jgi:hypothetical protein
MKTFSLNVGEWLLMLIDASDALVGDLHEMAVERSVRWYWLEWWRAASMTVRSAVRRHPLRTAWVGSMATIAAVGVLQVTVGLSQSCRNRTAKPHSHVWILEPSRAYTGPHGVRSRHAAALPRVLQSCCPPTATRSAIGAG